MYFFSTNRIIYIGTTNKLTDQWSTQKQHSLYETPSTTKPLYSYQTPRMPTDTEAMNVFYLIYK